VISCWMKGALNPPDGKRPHPPRLSETEGINLEGRGREILQGMKGWRPSALPRLDAGSGLVRQAYHMPDVGSIGLSFREVPGAQWTPGSLFALIGSAAPSRTNDARSVRNHEKAPALHLAQKGRGNSR
jgi:hypothetical protein